MAPRKTKPIVNTEGNNGGNNSSHGTATDNLLCPTCDGPIMEDSCISCSSCKLIVHGAVIFIYVQGYLIML